MNTVISEAEQLYGNIFETVSDRVMITDLETGTILAEPRGGQILVEL